MRSLATSSKCTNLDSREVSEKSRKSLERVSQPKNICSSLKTPWRVYFFTLIMVRDCTLWKKIHFHEFSTGKVVQIFARSTFVAGGLYFSALDWTSCGFSQGILQFVHTPHPMILKSAKGVNLNNGTKILWIRDVMYLIGHKYWKQNCTLFNNTLFDFRHKFWQKTTIAVKTGKWVGKTLKYI